MDMICPHCETFVSMVDSVGHVIRDDEGYHYVYSCRKCNQMVYVISGFSGGKEFQYPWSIPKLHASIPKDVTDDYTEAMKCLGGGSPKGALTMFRRCIQVASRSLGAKPQDLIKEIDELESKGIITKDLKDLAHQIRLLGNDGAHPNRPNVSFEEAKEIKEFVDNFFNYVFVMPHKVKSMKSKTTKKTKSQI